MKTISPGQPFQEPIRQTLFRTVAIAVVVGGALTPINPEPEPVTFALAGSALLSLGMLGDPSGSDCFELNARHQEVD